MKLYSDYLAYILVAIGVLFASVGVFYQYSYWWDELFSVTGAELSINKMFDLLIFNDVHPPLYNLTLKLWIGLFGSSEMVTRLLSFIFSISALLILWTWSKRNLGKEGFQAVVIFFSTCFLFSIYAQETRSYSMMLLFSSVLTVLYISSWHEKIGIKFLAFLFFVISLSLIHYFGFIYSGLIIILSIYDIKDKVGRVFCLAVAGLICFIWPAIHFVNGVIGSKSGNNFWIKSDGWQTTISTVSSGLTPQVSDVSWKILGGGYHAYLTAIIFIAVFLTLFWLAMRGAESFKTDRNNNQVVKLGLLFASFIVVVVLIDYHSPVSTRRNFIVVLPLFSIIVGLAFQGLISIGFKYVVWFLVVGGLSNLWVAAGAVKSKVFYGQDHAGAMRFIEKNRTSDDAVYYLAIDNYDMSDLHDLMTRYYASSHDFLNAVHKDKLSKISNSFYLLVQNQSEEVSEIEYGLRSLGVDLGQFVPQGNSGVVVFYSQ